MKVRKNINPYIFVLGFCLLLYIWFTQGEPIFEYGRQIGLFTTILPFIFTLASWIFGIMGYRVIKYAKQIPYMQLSFICCGIATWIFLLDIDLKIRNHDIRSLQDLAAYYSCISLFIWIITIWININTHKEKEMNHEKREN